MTFRKRRQALVYLTLAIIGTILLGVSLPGLRFQAGLPIPGADSVTTDLPVQEPVPEETPSPGLLPYGLALGIIFLFIAMIIGLVKKVSIKRIGLLAAAVVLLFVFFSLLPTLQPGQSDPIRDNQGVAQPPSTEYKIAPIGEPPAHLSFWVIAGLLLSSVVLISWLVSHAFHRAKKEESKLEMETKAAIQAIADGQSLKDIIIQYYAKMESFIAQERGIERGQAVTPREFETYLVEKGIPRNPIVQLTFLFEKARYGNQSLNKKDEQDAINCFSAIQKACQPDHRGTP